MLSNGARGGRAAVVIAVGLWLTLIGGPAFAHSEVESSDPAADSSVGDVPTQVTITFSEDPSADSKVEVRDGCNEDVAGDITTDGGSVVVAIEGGQPGGWSVSYDVISAEDGHETSGDYQFLVQGKSDCSKDSGTGDDGGDGGGTASGDPSDDSSSGAPVGLIIAIIAVVLIVVAFLVRRATAPRE